MADSAKLVISGLQDKKLEYALNKLFANLSTDIATLSTKHNQLAAKLDADAGVTDTNYVALTGVPATPQSLP